MAESTTKQYAIGDATNPVDADDTTRATPFRLVPDVILVNELKAGSHVAFEKLYDEYQHYIRNFIIRMLFNKNLVDEAVQETWINVWRSREKLNEPKAFTRWLYQIARFSTLKVTDRHKVGVNIRIFSIDDGEDDYLSDIADIAPDPKKASQLNEWMGIVDDEIKTMDTASQEIFHLRFNTPLTIHEIGETLSISPNTVGTKLRRGLQRLRKRLTQEGYEVN